MVSIEGSSWRNASRGRSKNTGPGGLGGGQNYASTVWAFVKLDVKDWGKSNGFCKIGDGDVDWPDVRKALGEIGFTGWSTAEVGGGKRERIQEIHDRMDKYLLGKG